MSRKIDNSCLMATLLGAALLASPFGVLAQRGASSIGGGTAGGEGLSGKSGIASGIDTKDDLKSFHEVMALQATSQQTVAYNLMVKITETAVAELHSLLEDTTKENSAERSSELQKRDKSFEAAIEQARTENTKFLDRLSDRQKAGLKESIKKLTKTDSELAQQAKALDGNIAESKAVAQIADSAQVLERSLATFHGGQLDLGQEMSIVSGTAGQDRFKIPPVTDSINFQNQPIAITTEGVISKGALANGLNTFRLELISDLSDLQQNFVEVLRAQLNKSDSCGEEISVQSAVLTASTPASVALMQLHYERWACRGRGVANEMAEGNGTIEVKLTPSIAADGTPTLVPIIGHVDADGLVGDLLRSGSLGETVRDKIAESLLSAVRQASNYKRMLPPSAQGNVTLQRVQFEGTGSGKLSMVVDGDIKVATDKVDSLTSELKAGEAKGQEAPVETTPR